jgi:hypothetical protein
MQRQVQKRIEPAVLRPEIALEIALTCIEHRVVLRMHQYHVERRLLETGQRPHLARTIAQVSNRNMRA